MSGAAAGVDGGVRDVVGGWAAGIEVRIDRSWAVIALLITYRRDLRRWVRYPQLSGVPCGVRRVPRPRWPTRRLRALMVPLGEQVMVAPDARMDAALGTLQDGEAGPVLVAQAGQVVGIITPSDLTHRPPRQQRSTSAPPEPVEWAARPQ